MAVTVTKEIFDLVGPAPIRCDASVAVCAWPACVFVRVCMRACVCLCVGVHACVRVCKWVCECVCICVSGCVCARVHVVVVHLCMCVGPRALALSVLLVHTCVSEMLGKRM